MRRAALLALFALAACSSSSSTSGGTTGKAGATATGGSSAGTTSSGGTTTGTTSATATTTGSTTSAGTTASSTTSSTTSSTGTSGSTGTNGSSVVANFTKVVSLHAVNRTGVVVFFHTDVSLLAGVDVVSTAGGAVRSTSDSSPTVHHAIQLTGLSPNTKYSYVVHAGTATASGDFTTAPDAAAAGNTPFTFAVVGDTRNRTDWQTVASAILAKNPAFIVQTGDNDADRTNSDQSWRDYYATAADLFAHVPVFAAQGNHDTVPDYSTFNLAPQSSSGSDIYYAFVYGNAGFVAIDGNSASSAQTGWVQGALNTLSGGPLFAFQHQPLYSCGIHGSSTSMQNTYQSLFESSHVTTNYTGHDHDLIYWAPTNGVNYVVSGGGGSTLYPLGGCSGPYSSSSLGFMLVTVNGASVTEAFYDETGAQQFSQNSTAFGPSVNFSGLGNLVVY
jgi:hypothetical protein